MADGRLYIRCDRCGESVMLCKHFCGPWYLWNAPDESAQERINNFLGLHYLECGNNAAEYSLFDSEED